MVYQRNELSSWALNIEHMNDQPVSECIQMNDVDENGIWSYVS